MVSWQKIYCLWITIKPILSWGEPLYVAYQLSLRMIKSWLWIPPQNQPILVCYHEDRCTQNKRMIRILMHGLFLTCTENSFFSAHIYTILKRVHICLKDKYSYLKRRSLFTVANSHLLRSLAWSQLPLRPLNFPHPTHLLPTNTAFSFLHKDDINKPDTSVGHNTAVGFLEWVSRMSL
jgi:hypothetical protein